MQTIYVTCQTFFDFFKEATCFEIFVCYKLYTVPNRVKLVKETKSATMNNFRFFFYFLFKSFVKVELIYIFTINLFTIADNCTEKWIIL